MDKQKQIYRVSDKIKYAKDTELALLHDLNTLSLAVSAVSKHTVGKTPSQRENKALNTITQEYSSFFVDDNEKGEEVTEEPKNPADSVGLLGRLVLVKNYLTQEKSVNSNIIDKLEQKRKNLRDDLKSDVAKKDESSKLGTIEKGESSKPSRAEQDSSAIPEFFEPQAKRVRFASPSDEKGKGKAREQDNSPSFDDFYNPFDDIGFD